MIGTPSRRVNTYSDVTSPVRGSVPATVAAPPEGKKNFQAWISPEAFDKINTWCRDAGVTRTAWLEAMSEWMEAHPYSGYTTPEGNQFILRARQITAESRARERG